MERMLDQYHTNNSKLYSLLWGMATIEELDALAMRCAKVMQLRYSDLTDVEIVTIAVSYSEQDQALCDKYITR